jgi:hypothetical protein
LVVKQINAHTPAQNCNVEEGLQGELVVVERARAVHFERLAAVWGDGSVEPLFGVLAVPPAKSPSPPNSAYRRHLLRMPIALVIGVAAIVWPTLLSISQLA